MLAGFLVMRAVLLVALVVEALLYVLTLPFKIAFDLLWRAVDAVYPQLCASPSRRRCSSSRRRAGSAGSPTTARRAWGSSSSRGPPGRVHGVPLPQVGTPIEDSEVIYSDLAAEVRRLDGVALTSLTVGVEKDTLTREIEDEHTSRLTVRLEAGRGPEAEEALIADVRSMVGSIPEMEVIDVRRPAVRPGQRGGRRGQGLGPGRPGADREEVAEQLRPSLASRT